MCAHDVYELVVGCEYATNSTQTFARRGAACFTEVASATIAVLCRLPCKSAALVRANTCLPAWSSAGGSSIVVHKLLIRHLPLTCLPTCSCIFADIHTAATSADASNNDNRRVRAGCVSTINRIHTHWLCHATSAHAPRYLCARLIKYLTNHLRFINRINECGRLLLS